MLDKIKIKIQGKNPDYFLKELIKQEIAIYNIEKKSSELIIVVDYSDYLKIKEIKTTYKISIITRYGINKYKYILNNHYLLIVFFLLGITINILLSNIIFSVEIIHPNKKLVYIINKDLKEYGLSKYHLKKTYKQKEIIKQEILKKETNILEWIEIEEKGTKYIVKIEERKKKKTNIKCPERHLIAKKNAIITDFDISSGEIVKKKNDYVTKGEVIVSGLIHNKETIVSKRCVRGKVYGETWYKVSLSLPKYYHKEKVLSGKKYGLNLKILNKNINIPNNLSDYKKKEYNIIKDNIVPIKISFTSNQKTEKIKVKRNLKSIEKEALTISANKIKENLKRDEQLLGKKVLKIVENNSKIDVEVFIKVKEDITDYEDITDLDIEKINEMNKKEE